jgi:hypothetical protein
MTTDPQPRRKPGRPPKTPGATRAKRTKISPFRLSLECEADIELIQSRMNGANRTWIVEYAISRLAYCLRRTKK